MFFYRKYDCDVFDVLQEQVEIFNDLGTVSVIGDLNGRVGLESDYIPDDTLDKQLLDNISFINYTSDNSLPQRLSEDTNTPNSFGRRILQLCKSSGLRICNGRFGTESKKITFNNKNGSSVIDYLLYSQDRMFNEIKSFCIEPFNTFSCHAPVTVEIYLKGKIKIIDQCNCSNHRCNIFKWNEGIEDDVRNQLLMNTQKFEDLLLNIDDNIDIDNCVDNLNKVLTDIFEQHTKSETIYREHCDFCVGQVKTFSAKNDKPWFTEECKTLYKQYQMAIDSFNKYRSNDKTRS